MKSCLFLFLSLFLTTHLFALSVSATSQASTCSANGTVTATATAGNAPYLYTISGGSISISSPSVSGSYTFSSLPSGTYNVTVIDNASTTATISVVVGGNYQEPVLTCSVSGCIIVATASLGLAPYTYAISNNGGTTFSAPQTSNIFTNLANGNYAIRVYDACQNFYPCYAQVHVLPLIFPSYTCAANGGMDDITLNLSGAGGASPYIITCTTGGNVVTNSTGVFSVPASCDHLIHITDACGNSLTDTVTACDVAPFAIEPICRNCNLGTFSVQCVGGSPPYAYSYSLGNNTYLTNTTGIFTGLPTNLPCYHINATDACGRASVISAACLTSPTSIGSSCPWTGEVTITPGFGGLCSVPPSVYPITVTCTSVTPTISMTQSTPPFEFTGLPYGTHDFTIVDGCGEIEQVSVPPVPLDIDVLYNLCDSISASTHVPGTTYTLWDTTQTIILATDTSGTFGGLQLGYYIVTAYHPLCDTQQVMIHVKIDLQMEVDCNVVTAKTCPEDSIQFELYVQNLSATWTLVNVANSNTGTYSFSGLVAGNFYHLHVIQLSSGETADEYFQTPQLSATLYVVCNDLNISVNPPFISGNFFVITDNNGAIVDTSSIAHFDNLPAGTFNLTIIHGVCDTLVLHFQVPPIAPTFCIRPSSYPLNGICKPGWDLKFDANYLSTFGPFSLSDSLGNPHAFCANAGTYPHLFPGKYVLTSNCLTDTVTIPEPVVPPIQVSAFAECPNLGKIYVSGYYTNAQWDSIGTVIGYSICPYNYFLHLYQNGGLLSLVNAINFPTTTFSSLALGATYKVCVFPYPPSYPCGACAIDTYEVVMPFYTSPNLTTTYGLLCGGATTGSIMASVTGGTPPYNFQIISPPGGTPIITNFPLVTFTGLPAGTYTIQVSDKCGISSDYSASVGPLNFIPQYTRFCNGTIQLHVPNIAGATYSWQDLNGNIVATTYNPIIASNGNAQTYTLTVNLNGCISTSSVSVPMQTGTGVVANAGPNMVAYNAVSNLNASPSPPNTIGTWSQILPNSGNTSFGNIHSPTTSITVSQFPGTYTYIWAVTDTASGCTSQDTVTVAFVTCQQTSPLNLWLTPYPTTCGLNNGAALGNLTGGVGPFIYSWSNGCTTAFNSGLAPGAYSLTVTDLSGCFAPTTKSVTVMGSMPVNGLITNLIHLQCYGDSIGQTTAGATQGQAPYLFALNNGSFGVSPTFANLAGGAYTITIMDDRGCSKILPFTIFEPDSLDIQFLVTNANCDDSSKWIIQANVLGGTGAYTYSWSNGQTTQAITNLTLGTYTVWVWDANNCWANKSITITAPPPLTITSNLVTNVSCFGGNDGSIAVSISGGQPSYLYSWDNGLSTNPINNLTIGNYTLYLTDANSCTTSQSFSLTQPSLVVIDSIITTNVTCFGLTNGTAQAQAHGGTGTLSYSWSNGVLGQSVNNLGAGNPTLHVTDANNCQVSQNLIITSPPLITIDSLRVDNVKCAGGNTGAVYVHATGGTGNLTYSWSNGHIGQTLTQVYAGNYLLYISDVNNCQIIENITISQPLPLQVATQTLANACNGLATGSIMAIVSGGTSPYSYLWSNGQTTQIATNLALGTHTVTITDANGCKNTASTTILPFTIVLSPTNISCFGQNDGQISVFASGGVGNYTYSWNNNVITSLNNNLSPGNYTVWVTDTTSCLLSSSAIITQPNPLTMEVDSIKIVDCFGANTGKATLAIAGGTKPYLYSWSPAPVTYTPNPSGLLAQHLSANTYQLWITDKHNCQDSISFTISQIPQMVVTVADIESAFCDLPNGNAWIQVVGGNGNYTYSWNTNPSQTSAHLQNVAEGSYKVYITDQKGCKTSLVLSMPNVPPPTTYFTSSPNYMEPIVENQPILFQNLSLNAYSYSWNFGDMTTSTTINPQHIYSIAASYTVTLTGFDAHKMCPTSYSITYPILPDGQVFIPNVFTPNEDGLNEGFTVIGLGIVEMELIIYDRWGIEITTLKSPAEAWDGKKKGIPCPEGAYTYKADILLNSGARLRRGGTVTLIR